MEGQNTSRLVCCRYFFLSAKFSMDSPSACSKCDCKKYESRKESNCEFCGHELALHAPKRPNTARELYLPGLKQKKRPPKTIPLNTSRVASFFEKKRIQFYNAQDVFYEFTNFWDGAPFRDDVERYWPTSEHFFQGMKFDELFAADIINQLQPNEVEKFVETYKLFLRPEFNYEEVMLIGLRAKFKLHNDLREILLSTSPKPLVYVSNDRSIEVTNKISELLVKIRTELLAGNGNFTANSNVGAASYPPTTFSDTDGLLQLSNFFPRQIQMDHKVYPSVEHFFHSSRFFSDTKGSDLVRWLPTPRMAFDFARKFEVCVPKDWVVRRDQVMRIAIQYKFSNHSELKELLMSTSDYEIVEHTTNDSYWGDGGGNGQNKLGKLLVELREKFKAEGKSLYQ